MEQDIDPRLLEQARQRARQRMRENAPADASGRRASPAPVRAPIAEGPGMVDSAARFIAREEQFRPRAYRDMVGRGQPWTVGYGRTGPDVGPNTTMTEPEALQWVVDRVRRDSAALARAGVQPSPGLLSFVYNTSPAIITDPRRNTGIGRAARAGDWGQVAQELQRWIYGSGSGRPVVQGGLVRRRRGEAQMLPDTTLRALLGGTDQ